MTRSWPTPRGKDATPDRQVDRRDVSDILADLMRAVEVIRDAGGYGEIQLRVVVRPDGIARWHVAPEFSRKSRVTRE